MYSTIIFSTIWTKWTDKGFPIFSKYFFHLVTHFCAAEDHQTKRLFSTYSKKSAEHAVHLHNLGPVVQSIVSLMSSLRVISLTVLVDSI